MSVGEWYDLIIAKGNTRFALVMPQNNVPYKVVSLLLIQIVQVFQSQTGVAVNIDSVNYSFIPVRDGPVFGFALTHPVVSELVSIVRT